MNEHLTIQVWPGVTSSKDELYTAVKYHLQAHPVNQRPANTIIASLVILSEGEGDIVILEPIDSNGTQVHIMTVNEAQSIPALWQAISDILHPPRQPKDILQ